MKFIYFSHPEIETLYPLRKRDSLVPLQSLMGKPVGARVLQQVQNLGFEEVLVAFPGSHELLEYVKPPARIAPIEWSQEAARALASLISTIDDEFFVLQLGSAIAGPEVYASVISRWNETSRSTLLLVPYSPGEDVVGVHSVRYEVDLARKVIRGVCIGGQRGLYFSGIMISDKRLASELSERRSILEAIVSFSSKDDCDFHVWSGSISAVNSPFNLLSTVKELLSATREAIISTEARISPTAVIEGVVVIERDAIVDHYCVIKGPAFIGRGALVGAHSFVRSYVSVEPGAVVGSGAEVKRSYIGPRAVVGSQCHITDSVIGDAALLRPMCVTLNYDPREAARGAVFVKRGSVIGEKALINGGSVLQPKCVVEPESFFDAERAR
ncbi:MAG: NDP-sugar synthase [Fervidicoccaceae archaeon]